MKQKKKILAIFCLVIIFSLIHCSQITQRLAILNCVYSFLDIEPVKMKTTSLDLKLSIQIDNPNPADVILDKLGFDFFINDNKVFEGIMEKQMKIPNRSTSVLNHIIAISYLRAGAVIVTAIKEKRASYRLTGKVYYNTPIGNLEFPVDIVKKEI